MIAATRRAVLLADHTKLGNDHLVRFADLDDIDTLVTDVDVHPEFARELEAAGLTVVRA
jgi:DeoR family transcriptional regulator, fructose operon transcriptional repressor